MEDEDNFDLLFQQKLNDDLFNINSNNDLEVLKKKAKQSQTELIKFIDTILDDSNREKFHELLDIRDDNYNECFFLEHRLFYKYGINDGFSMCLASLRNKIDFCQ